MRVFIAFAAALLAVCALPAQEQWTSFKVIIRYRYFRCNLKNCRKLMKIYKNYNSKGFQQLSDIQKKGNI